MLEPVACPRVQEIFEVGQNRDAAALIAAGKRAITRDPGIRLDYFEIVDPETLEPIVEIVPPASLACSGRFRWEQHVSLIDNVMLS